MKKQIYCWTILIVMMSISLTTPQAQTTYETLTYPSGAKYVGEVRNEAFNGQGTWTHPDGEKYVGEWKDNKRHGKGTIFDSDGKVVKGIFMDGELVGRQ